VLVEKHELAVDDVEVVGSTVYAYKGKQVVQVAHTAVAGIVAAARLAAELGEYDFVVVSMAGEM